jgi:autotransporter-associated beta strand protein
MKLIICLLIGFGIVMKTGAANLSVHSLFTNHMVLQHDAADPVWGWAAPGTTVTVMIYDQNSHPVETNTATAGSDGKWEAMVGPFGLVTNNAAYSMTISDESTTITLTDILIGDVWLCSGQSNMDYSLATIGVINLAQEVADSTNYPTIRCFTVPHVSAYAPQTNLPAVSWAVAGATTTSNFTATGYFTAREIYKQQHIPIGIICSAWYGSEINPWIDLTTASNFADFTQTVFDQTSQTPTPDVTTISGTYNAMIYPIAPFKIKAVEWYQGENNTAWPEQYGRLLPLLMSSWRSLFEQPALPFIIIQLPNYGTVQTLPVETGSWAELREAQQKSVFNDPNSRLVTTIDIGAGLLHPTDKQDVGLRAAWAAANLVYGQNNVNQGPILTDMRISGTNIICSFGNVGDGLMAGTKSVSPLTPVQQLAGGTLVNFAVCGADKAYYAANALITATNQVSVSSPYVTVPVAVRYAWGDNPPCNLYNTITDENGNVTNGLPGGSLRSDPVYLLNVNSGSGTGYHALGTQVNITSSLVSGEAFDHWSGDTGLVSGASNTTTTVSVSQTYISLLANYRITAAPSGLATALEGSQVSLSWNPMSAVHYNLYRATNSTGPYTIIATNLFDATNYVDTNVTGGLVYYYEVSAVNLLGEGPNSSPVSAGTQLAITTQPTSQTAYLQDTIQFVVAAAGIQPIHYQWLSGTNGIYANLADGGQFSGAMTAALTVSNLALTDPTNYLVVVSNVYGAITSSPAILTVLPTTRPVVTLKSSDAQNTTSFTGATNWSNNSVPSSNNNYLVANSFGLRTPTSTAIFTFAGRSLTLSNAVVGVKTGSGSTIAFGNFPATGCFLNDGTVAIWDSGQIDTIAGFVTLQTGGGVFDPNNGSLTASAQIGGLGTLTLNTSYSGGGTVVLSGNNTYTGGNILNSANTLQLSGEGTLGATDNPLQIINTDGKGYGTLDLNGTSQSIGTLSGTGGIILNNATGSSSTLIIGNGNTGGGSFSGAIANGAGTLSLTKTGSGIITLSGTNAYGGVTSINGGALVLSGSGALRNSSSIVVGDSTLDISRLTSNYSYPYSITMTNSVLNLGSVLISNNELSLNDTTVQLSTVSSIATNIVTSVFTLDGLTNTISILSLPTASSYPARFTVIKYASSAGVMSADNKLERLGVDVPVADNITGYLTNNTSKGTIDLVLINPSVAPIILTNYWNGTNIVLSWPGAGRLLEATNITGSWMLMSNVISPFTVTPSMPQIFYRVELQ